MQTESQTKKFRTRDYLLRTFVKAKNSNIPFQTVCPRPDKVEYITDATDALYRIIAEYNSNAPVPVQDFIEAMKDVKDEMMDLLRSQRAGVPR